MCGITGWLAFGGFRDTDAHPVIRAMTGALRHRGPDDDGTWLDGRAGIALGSAPGYPRPLPGGAPAAAFRLGALHDRIQR